MNSDQVEGNVRSAIGQAKQAVGDGFNNPSLSRQGAYDNIAGKVQSAAGGAADALHSGVDAVANIDLTGLRDEVAKLSKSVADMLQKQAATTRDQVVDAVSSASEILSDAASVAKEKFVSVEADLEERIKGNPMMAVGIAVVVGVLIGKIVKIT